MFTTQNCIADITRAIDLYGTFAYYTFGPGEVDIDINKYLTLAKQMDSAYLGKILVEISAFEHGNNFVLAILRDCGDMPNKWWEDLMNYNPILPNLLEGPQPSWNTD